MGIPILVRWNFYIESAPWFWHMPCVWVMPIIFFQVWHFLSYWANICIFTPHPLYIFILWMFLISSRIYLIHIFHCTSCFNLHVSEESCFPEWVNVSCEWCQLYPASGQTRAPAVLEGSRYSSRSCFILYYENQELSWCQLCCLSSGGTEGCRCDNLWWCHWWQFAF